jgi:hypothetical protein
VQALDRTQPSLPFKRGRAQMMTRDYKRHGTTDLFAALTIASGELLDGFGDAHAGADVLASTARSVDCCSVSLQASPPRTARPSIRA